ncbi:S-methyl-5-thioribose-1-phosphate isomerase [Pseudoflavonifractor sp. AF19-9AC]|uniref:S-methyl-5-thioribose-1-phosphate isomerase n=1 Tax=Pseudoflavonifractor sp. AF19-9AC TaxID=2292244 RepID=UPI000E5071E0|nr:S-methyl-5-thioribose-1-phosphate isomerase [Pseudoflavonifractor sp. AF19-9AC]RHR07427.1 S-methyl-5-thioribose-1-phosphate isomerase [Pseudoflavonifractor sp. AF19-9AC]
MAEFLDNVRLSPDGTSVILLDQSLLPNRMEERQVSSLEDMVEAIQALRVRGAPAIGIFAGYCLYVLAGQLERQGLTGGDFFQELDRHGKILAAARPTAVNLAWAVDRLSHRAASMAGASVSEIVRTLGEEARAIHREDMEMCENISRYGLSLLKEGDGVLTHCNAGPLATSRYGTGQGPFHLAAQLGMKLKVYADETRPLLQGARLTAWELQRAGVDVTLICDNMASMVMKNGWIQACMVGCDRVAANGDVANKIGTSGVAILAKHYGIPFYVLGPTSTIDLNCPDGDHIPIEERDGEEIRSLWYREPMAPEGVKCYNPAFDVAPNELITAIITEKGICRPPYTQSLAALFAPEYK